jgi:phenylalanyl-tRNA synthetase beta chain
VRAVWSWLRELVDLDGSPGVEEAAQAFTRAGLEVEGLEQVGGGIDGVVVAAVVGVQRHPDADKLTVVDVIDRPGGTATRVVCGAPNVPGVGGKVLWARPGATLPGGVKIGVRALKGIESAGMLCSERELGLSEAHEGIAVLTGAEAAVAPGTGVSEALGLRDAVFEISAPANRGDVLGHRGLARELAAVLGGRLRPAAELLAGLDELTDAGGEASTLVEVSIADPEACPRYVARILTGLTVGPSPRWLQRRLRLVGVRPLSNLVDVTNYVLFELGQPLHAFDLDRLRGGRIDVRRARAGERITTLDEVERPLEPGDLLICDGAGPVALAGVMGGASSEVRDDTRRVLLESAAFQPQVVRRTSRRLGLISEASQRFERGVDAAGADLASQRAALLLARVGGGVLLRGALDVHPRKIAPVRVHLRPERARALLGVDVSRAQAIDLLGRLECIVHDPGAPAALEVECPTFRPDLLREVDLIEELIRLQGFAAVPATLPSAAVAPLGVRDERPALARGALAACGLAEAITFGFTSPERLAFLRLPDGERRMDPVRLRNPMSSEQSVMRTSLLPNLLAAVARNQSFGIRDIGLFEVGSVFLRRASQQPEEPQQVAGVLSGAEPGWLGPARELDFYDLKGVVERLLEALLGERSGQVRFAQRADVPYFHPGVCAAIQLIAAEHEPREIGLLGEVHPESRRLAGIEGRCLAFELALEALPGRGRAQMRPIARFPAVVRDLSFFVAAEVPAQRVRDLIDACSESLIEQVSVLEDYRDPERVPAGKKGMLWSITYRSPTGTLTDKEVDRAHEAVVDQVLAGLGALRR